MSSTSRKPYAPLNQPDKADKKWTNPYCLVCFETGRGSVGLQCGHAFCAVCIQEYNDFECHNNDVTTNVTTDKNLSCPVCAKTSIVVPRDQTTPMTPDVVNSRKFQLTRVESGIVLQRCDSCVFRGQTEIANLHCQKCSLNLCAACADLHDKCRVFSGHDFVQASNKENLGLQCEIHSKMTCAYFCEFCRSPACSVCVLHYHSESKHEVVALKDLLGRAAHQLKDLLRDIDAKRKRLGDMNDRLLFNEQSSSKLYKRQDNNDDGKRHSKDAYKKSDSNGSHARWSTASAPKSEPTGGSFRNGFHGFFSSGSVSATVPPSSPRTAPPGHVFVIGDLFEEPASPTGLTGPTGSTENELAPTNDNDSNSMGSEELSQSSLTYRTALGLLKKKILHQRKSEKGGVKKVLSADGFVGGSVGNVNASESTNGVYVTTEDRNFVNKLQRSLDGWSKLNEYSNKLLEMPCTKKAHLLYEDAISRSKVILICIERKKKKVPTATLR